MTHGVQRLLDLVAFAVAGCVLSGCGGSTERAGIDRAVRAPLVAYIARDGPALCNALTPTVARHLAAPGAE